MLPQNLNLNIFRNLNVTLVLTFKALATIQYSVTIQMKLKL